MTREDQANHAYDIGYDTAKEEMISELQDIQGYIDYLLNSEADKKRSLELIGRYIDKKIEKYTQEGD